MSGLEQTTENSTENPSQETKKPCLFFNNRCFIHPVYQYERFCPYHPAICPWYERMQDYLSRQQQTR